MLKTLKLYTHTHTHTHTGVLNKNNEICERDIYKNVSNYDAKIINKNNIAIFEQIKLNVVGVGVPDDPNAKNRYINKIMSNNVSKYNSIYPQIKKDRKSGRRGRRPLQMAEYNLGITLIALIITIIVLLILAGVTLNMVMGENGIIKKAQQAMQKTNISNAKEEIQLAIVEEETNANSGENLGNKFNYENVWNTLRKNDENLEVKEKSEEKVFIIKYKGYYFKIDENKNVTYIDEVEADPEENEYKIVYNKNDGTEEKLEEIVPKDQEITLDTTKFSRGGYIIEGWYNNPEGTGDKIIKVSRNIEVYAKWKEVTNIESKGSTTIGNITYSDSYEIWNKSQLLDFRNKVNNGNKFENCIIKQKADINLNNITWIPIGTYQNYFSGTYDGEEHTIEGININQANFDQGLFSYVYGTENEYAEVANLTAEGNIIGTYNVGGIAGRVNYGNIKNCVNKINVKSTGHHSDEPQSANSSSVGGIVGRIEEYGGNIENCKNYGTITGSYDGIGGIVGWIRKGNIIGCENYSNINNNVVKVGGISGCSGDGTNIVSFKKVKNTGEIIGNNYVGGITGYLRKNGNIEQAVNNAYIGSTGCDSAYYSRTGGIIGCTGENVAVSYSYNTGNIQSNYRAIGGIIGYVYSGSIQYCYNIGNITNKNTGIYTGRTGGIVGIKYTGRTFPVTECWQLKNCIKSGIDNEKISTTEKSETEIKQLKWDNFTVNSEVNNGYPILSWENT